MKRVLYFLMVFFFIVPFCGCADAIAADDGDFDPVVIEYSDDGTVNGYLPSGEEGTSSSTVSRDENGRLIINSQPSPSSGSDSTANGGSVSDTYCGNKNTKKLHLSDCSAAARSKPENLIYSNNRQSMLDKGYQPCKLCNP